MPIKNILAEIDAEIARLQQARVLLSGDTVKRGLGRPPAVPIEVKKRNLSAEGRARIAAAVKARWAKQKKAKG
jgi:hypothetical protein